MQKVVLRAVTDRAHPRTSVFLQSNIETADRRANAIVRNLSAGGACLSIGGALPRSGQAICLTLRHIGQIGGKIMWVRAGRIGVAFDRAINPVTVMSNTAI